MSRRLLALAAFGLTALLLSEPALAQDGLSPGFGARNFPHYREAGVDARLFTAADGTRCGGYIGQTPDFRVAIAEPIEATLRESYGMAVSFLVYGPDGLRCTGEPRVGAIFAGPWPAGSYQVYVGEASVGYGSSVTAELAEPGAGASELGALGRIFEGDSAQAERFEGGIGLLGTGEVPMGSSWTFEGFELDGEYPSAPGIVTGTWTAALDAQDVMAFFGGGDCPGRVSSSQSHTLYSYGSPSGPRLYVESPADAVVLVQGPIGGEGDTLVCVGDSRTDPAFDFAGRMGEFRIWVGAQSGEGGEYRLRFELEGE